jgi:L-threonylcarbamoyladenylate synthase
LSEIHRLGSERPGDPRNRRAVDAAIAALHDGKAVVLPTDTVYGIAVRPDDAAAVDGVFRLKRRPSGLSLPVLASESSEAWPLVVPNVTAEALAGAFWPGALTMVLRRSGVSLGWRLGEARDTLAIRVPDHAPLREVLRAAGPLAVTSANRSGETPIEDTEDLTSAFGEGIAVYVLAPASGREPGPASTIVDVTGGEVRVIRAGALDARRLESVADSIVRRASR